MNRTWPDEAVAELKRLWPAGGHQSASVCARKINDKFGLSVTRNAVIGKVNRLGMGGTMVKASGKRVARRSPEDEMRLKAAGDIPKIRSARNRTIIAGNGTVFRAGPSLLAGLRDLPPDHSPCAVTLMALQVQHCRWPVDDRLFCGDTKLDGCAYCARHAARAFRRGGE